ncbi:MAG: hypothetical protein IKR18_10965 [Bacteroidaceae bacterium]|nr:hypothetical protein [Bacteroidaceae bacterium]
MFIPDSHVDSRDDENCSYMFRLNGAEHDLYPNDRVMIGISDTGNYQTGRVSKCTSDTLLIKTDWPLEKSDSYSVEAILFPL